MTWKDDHVQICLPLTICKTFTNVRGWKISWKDIFSKWWESLEIRNWIGKVAKGFSFNEKLGNTSVLYSAASSSMSYHGSMISLFTHAQKEGIALLRGTAVWCGYSLQTSALFSLQGSAFGSRIYDDGVLSNLPCPRVMTEVALRELLFPISQLSPAPTDH